MHQIYQLKTLFTATAGHLQTCKKLLKLTGRERSCLLGQHENQTVMTDNCSKFSSDTRPTLDFCNFNNSFKNTMQRLLASSAFMAKIKFPHLITTITHTPHTILHAGTLKYSNFRLTSIHRKICWSLPQTFK